MSKLYNKNKSTNKKMDTDSSISMEVQKAMLTVLTDEFTTASKNMKSYEEDFEEFYNMLRSIRDGKQNEWESDISLPEFISRIMTQVGLFVGRYFSSRDFVEPDLDSDEPEDVIEARASKNLLNTLLNDKDAHYYQKVVRLLMNVFPFGYGVIKGGYEQETEQIIDGYETQSEYVQDEFGNYLADDGYEYTDTETQSPMMDNKQVPIYKQKTIKDRPTFDIYPNQNVYMSSEYVYTLQDKDHIIFESEETLDKLNEQKESHGYFNLHLLEDIDSDIKAHREKTSNYDKKKDEEEKPILKRVVILERLGVFPMVFKERNEKGIPIDPKPGIDNDGKIKDKAENVEGIITTVKSTRSTNLEHLIRFQASPFTRRPVVRFLCYVDPVKDSGFGDGQLVREIARAVNDNYNLMNFRTKLATTPAFKRKRFAGMDEYIKISPEKAIDVENMDDLQEFEISDDISGGIDHHRLLISGMDDAMSAAPQTRGQSPERKETATQASIIGEKANIRIGMKSLNLEFIGFTEFYDMLLGLCNDFMLPETLEELIGKDAFAYNPKRRDRFKPVSQALETEDSKREKIKSWDQLAGIIASVPNPKTPMVLNYIIGQRIELMGGSFKHFKKFMFEEDQKTNLLYQIATGGQLQKPGMPGTAGAQGKSGQRQPQPKRKAPPGGGPQNQTGLPQSPREQKVRLLAGGRR